jgi:hypothetical protein
MNVYDTLFQAARQWPDRDGDHRCRRLAGLPIALARNRVPASPACPAGACAKAREWACGRATDAPSSSARWPRWAAAPRCHAHPPPDEAGRIGGHAGARAVGLHPGRRLRHRPSRKNPRNLELSGRPWLRFTRLDGPPRPLAPGFEDAAFVRFTSGTTGAAKGVVLTHRAVIERITAANNGLGSDLRRPSAVGLADGLSLLRFHPPLPRRPGPPSWSAPIIWPRASWTRPGATTPPSFT